MSAVDEDPVPPLTADQRRTLARKLVPWIDEQKRRRDETVESEAS